MDNEWSKRHANAVLNMWVMFAIFVVSWLCTRVWIGLIRYALVSGGWVGNPIVFWSKICEKCGYHTRIVVPSLNDSESSRLQFYNY